MDLSQRKKILRQIANGLFIVTGTGPDGPVGAVISFLTQTSIEPPLIAMAIRVDSVLYRAAHHRRNLAVHFIDRTNQAMVAAFFKPRPATDKLLNGYPFRVSELGNPLLEDAAMILETEVEEIVARGDHHLFVCRVVNAILNREVEILAMHHTNWHYGG
jgi:flavin reductase (DIM6/NTAB) family NADH-FMN oxidoreductase RutF